MKYVKVIIDNTSDHTDTFYTYECEDDAVKRGSVVRVPFGRGNRVKTAYVFEVLDEDPGDVKDLKSVKEIAADYTIPEQLLQMCEWMKQKYLCRYIDGIKCMIPPGDAPKGKIKGRLSDVTEETSEPPKLTPEQDAALKTIAPYIDERIHRAFLINGVTASGKTELYMRITEKVLKEGRSVIILVPEISLTPQTISRFTGRFGNESIAVLHSRMTKRQRYDQWMRVRNNEARIVIGARSGVYAPFDNLGAIIIDEEHDSSYKSDMSPKYDAVDAAVERGRLSGAIVVLGTATPSVVSEYKARQGEYEEIFLRTRYNKTPLPDVSIADMRAELRSGNKTIFSRELFSRIKGCLAARSQVILFLNRRGYSTFISCRMCGYVMKCPACDLSMTYHKSSGMAECHYCGRSVPVPKKCPECGSAYIRYFGIGTEKVEELTKEAFPDAEVARLDLDTARRKGAAERILNKFKKGETDILVGTQLVAKGIDISNVGLVGIMAADITLNIPDYRSSERTFQLIVQASGRAGRGGEKGNVVIQTYTPDNKALIAASENDYDAFYDNEIRMRMISQYPPFTNIIRLVFVGSDEKIVIKEAQSVYNVIIRSGIFEKGEVFAPQPAYMAFVNDTWRYHIVIKSPVEKTVQYLELIRQIKDMRTASPKTKSNMLVEVDPYSLT